MARLLVVAMVLMVGASAWAEEKARNFGWLTYPAVGNIEWDEGTVELWMVAGFDAAIKTPEGMTLFDVMLPEGGHYYLGYINWANSLAQIGFSYPRHSYVWSSKLNWKKGERHYVVWTWSGRTRSLYIDGKSCESGRLEAPLQGEGRGHSSANVVVEGALTGNLTATHLMVGSTASVYTADELRISSVARTPEEIARTFAASSSLTRDEFTLLLDHCDGGPAEVISGLSGETGATLNRAVQVVNVPGGKGIQLYKEQ